MKNRWTKTAAIVLFAVLVMTLGAVAAFAQDDATPQTPEKQVLPEGHGGYSGGFHGRSHGRDGCQGARGDLSANDEALADSLGITVDELQAARQKAAADRIAQAVEDDLLTRDQANTLLAMQALKGYLDREALMAQAFGFTPEEFAAAREAGTLRELLSEIDMAALQENMQSAVADAVQQAVADNVITEEQAALVLAQLENGLGMRGKFGGGYHDFDGRRGGHHGFRGAPRDNSDSDGEAFSPFRTFRSAPAFDA